MGLLLQCDLGNNRDLEYINTSGCLSWGRQFWNTIAIWSVDAWRGFSILKDKCNFIPTETAIHLRILSNCSQVTGSGSSPWQARERSRWQRQSGRRQGLPAVPEPASIIGVQPRQRGWWHGKWVPSLAELEMEFVWVQIVWKALASSVHLTVMSRQSTQWLQQSPRRQGPKDGQFNGEIIGRVWCNPFIRWCLRQEHHLARNSQVKRPHLQFFKFNKSFPKY